jgi:hypothetical protein
MTVAAPISGHCATHTDVIGNWACQRCGSFVCRACERRTRPEAPPLCPACWDVREQVVGKLVRAESRKTQIAGLVLGCVSVFHPLILVASLIINIRALLRGAARSSKRMHVGGLIGSGVAVLIWITAIIVFVALH